jgi:SAM-dependent methyltransferase
MLRDSPKTEFIKFSQRSDRTQYVFTRFRNYFEGRTLDVGCYEAPLRNLIGRHSYVGVDIVGDPDIQIDLNANCELPFADNEFQTVIAIETLEHVDNLHKLFSECIRVSGRFVILSLPNCWRDARRPLTRGKGSFAHYGLPIEPPLDRHRWFFNFSEALYFFRGMAKIYQLEIIELFGTEQPRNLLVRLLRKLTYGREGYQNRYSQTAWAVFKKN